ncbi:MAG: GIY-YIG nuclease family protein [Candidatus Portnoybacteria bacterium]|nr:GIY-YIG nuclease family protein [Candidatus Portnoybacteria bacterium]
MNMWTLYILFCDQKTFYVGITDNIQRRLRQHLNKESFYTKKFSDLELIHTENFATRKEAENREKQIKGWCAAKKKALIKGDKETLIRLSKCREVVDDSCGRKK